MLCCAVLCYAVGVGVYCAWQESITAAQQQLDELAAAAQEADPQAFGEAQPQLGYVWTTQARRQAALHSPFIVLT